MALAPRSTFVRGGAYVLGNLRFEPLLKHPLEDLLKEAGVVQQSLLRYLRVPLTMILGHRRSLAIG